jgi:dTDP-4-dehydrorhamnose reductase/UDP-glucose 4-epimerase
VARRSRLAVLGGHGFIARHVAAALPADDVLVLPHPVAREGALPPDVSAVLWGGRHPTLGTPAWRLDDEPELHAARLAAARGLPFLTLGTRKVYAPKRDPFREDDPTGPVDRYGEQKLAIEQALLDVSGDCLLTRLRLSNVFGHEPGRPTFVGRMVTTLAADGEIRFDMNPFTRRDFIPAEFAGHAIAALLRAPPGGIVNVGSGIALECGRLALWLIEGRGAGRLVCASPDERDAFALDVGRMRDLTGVVVDERAIRAACLAVGRDAGRRG